MDGELQETNSRKMRKRGHGNRSAARIGRKFKGPCKIDLKAVDAEQSTPSTSSVEFEPSTPSSSEVIPVPILSSSEAIPVPVPVGWTDVSSDSEQRFCEITRQDIPDTPPLVVARSLVVQPDSSWMVHVHGHQVDQARILSFLEVPSEICPATTATLLSTVATLAVCIGNPESRFVELAKQKGGNFLSSTGEVVAYVDKIACVSVEGQQHLTVRCADCQLLVSKEIDSSRCFVCEKYRKTLYVLLKRASREVDTTKRNYIFLRTPEWISRIRSARKTIRVRNQKIVRMRKRLKYLTSVKGVELDKEVQEEILTTIEENEDEIKSLPTSDFRKVFWNQQVTASKAKGKRGIRWHPLFVRWCLNLSRVSPKAYEIISESGFLMPTRRTLNDYTHWVSAKPGFSHEIDTFLLTEARVNELEDWQKYVVLVLDEMKIQEDLVFDSTGKWLHGFVNLGDIGNELQALEREVKYSSITPSGNIATHMLTLMVRGIFTKLEFPYASFPTQGVVGHSLYWIMWEAVRRLEMIGLKVIVFVCDGAKANRRFLNSLGREEDMKNGVVYKTVNRYSPDRFIYFISDAPHLMKTTRNCWYSSSFGGTRCMWNKGKHILWEHLITLWKKTQAESGLFLGHRLTYEHLHLTSFSKMKVNLAVQVLSASTSAGFSMLDSASDEYGETAKFCHMFDKFFDCLNTRNASEGKKKRKQDLEPYRRADDRRFEWLEGTFLKYLEDWELSIKARKGFTDEEKKAMTLSRETLQGLRMTVYSFVEVSKFLLSKKDGLFLLSERFNQDPLEAFFGQQRARGGRSDNPNARSFLYNAQAIRVQRSMAIGHGGNVRKRKQQWTTDLEDLSHPLKKRRA